MNVQTLIHDLIEKINQKPEQLSGMNTVIQFDLQGEGTSTYQVKVHDGRAELSTGETNEAKAIFSLSDQDFIKLVQGSLNPTTAFMMGKVKIKGDLGAAMKLQSLLKAYQDGGL